MKRWQWDLTRYFGRKGITIVIHPYADLMTGITDINPLRKDWYTVGFKGIVFGSQYGYWEVSYVSNKPNYLDIKELVSIRVAKALESVASKAKSLRLPKVSKYNLNKYSIGGKYLS